MPDLGQGNWTRCPAKYSAGHGEGSDGGQDGSLGLEPEGGRYMLVSCLLPKTLRPSKGAVNGTQRLARHMAMPASKVQRVRLSGQPSKQGFGE